MEYVCTNVHVLTRTHLWLNVVTCADPRAHAETDSRLPHH